MLEREYNFNKDISYLEDLNQWFFSSDLLHDKEIFINHDDLNQIINELRDVEVIKPHIESYDEYEVLYVDFKDRTDAKIFLKDLNEYISFCENYKEQNIKDKRVSEYKNIKDIKSF